MSEGTRTTFVEIQNLVKRFGGVQVVQGVSIGVEEGRVVALLGPSGCGKTTILRCLAGLEVPDAGIIRIGDQVVNDAARKLHLGPEARKIGMVFQAYAVWPHMTVFGNVAFPLQVRGVPARQVREQVEETLRLVGLEGFIHRPAPMLSGGQQQRVALARALVSHPRVVLFDEPLSNLDARLRERMRFELANLQQRIGFTAIYVTHDQEEAMALADRLVLLAAGQIQQQGSPQEIYQAPATPFVADFVGLTNGLPGTTTGPGRAADTVKVELEGGLGSAEARARAGQAAGQAVMVVFRPEAVQLSAEPVPGVNCFQTEVESALYAGSGFDYRLVAGEHVLRYRGMPAVAQAEQDRMYACVAPADCYAVPR